MFHLSLRKINVSQRMTNIELNFIELNTRFISRDLWAKTLHDDIRFDVSNEINEINECACEWSKGICHSTDVVCPSKFPVVQEISSSIFLMPKNK